MPHHSNEDLEGADSCRFLSAQSPHDKPWDEHRQAADKVARLYNQIEYISYSEKITSCARWLQFSRNVSEAGEVKLKLFSTWFCRKRHCPICQWRRSLMWCSRMFKALPQVFKNYPTARFVFLTLTVKNCPLDELRTTLGWMNQSWHRLIKRKDWPALGFVRATEVSRNATTGYAHPHFHCLLMVPGGYFSGGRYLTQARWTELWQTSLRVDYSPMVNIKAIKPKFEGASSLTPDKAMFGAICETLKYTVKEGDLTDDPEWLGELTKQLFKLKLISTGGVLKEYLSEDEPEDLIHTDLETEQMAYEDKMLLFDWYTDIKRYAERKDIVD